MGSKPRDPEIIVWMEIRAPEQPDEWNDYFQPMIQAPGHAESSWAKMPERLDTVLIATCWYFLIEYFKVLTDFFRDSMVLYFGHE